jgi:hypothetical protein
VAGTPAGNIAKVSTFTGSVVKSWARSASRPVDTVLYVPNGHVLVGGKFTSINGSGRNFYASLNPSTGRDDGYLNLSLSGTYVYPGAGPNYTQAYNQQLSPDGRHVLVEGVFTAVQGQSRQQIFMLNLDAHHGNLSAWNSSEFGQHCSDAHPFYVKGAAWSPDQATVYIATTGEHLSNWSGSFPLTGLCDVAAAFPAAQAGGLDPTWVNYTGCDSLYSAAADGSTVYVGGHERWADNPRGCNEPGPGAIPAPGMGAFTPDGSLLTKVNGTAGRYSRARGFGADDMLRTSAGLWIASDNFDDSVTCDGVTGHAGICFLPNS